MCQNKAESDNYSIPILVFLGGTRKLKFALLYFGKTQIGLVYIQVSIYDVGCSMFHIPCSIVLDVATQIVYLSNFIIMISNKFRLPIPIRLCGNATHPIFIIFRTCGEWVSSDNLIDQN